MVAYTHYERDGRVRRYAETLVKRGDSVDLIALRGPGREHVENIGGVRVFGIQTRPLNERNRVTYLLRHLLFFLRSMMFLMKRELKQHYHLIHVHSPPDFQVFVAWLAKLRGSKIILDLHDLVPEFYASKFHATRRTAIWRMLVWIEKLSAAFADHVIVANDIWHDRVVRRSADPSKCTAIINYPDLAIFCRHGRERTDSDFVVLYPGTFNYHQGVDIAIRSLARIKDRAPDVFLRVVGGGEQKDNLLRLKAELNLDGRVSIESPVSLPEAARIMENADLGVVPKRADGFGNEAFSTKILEFMCQDVPVVVSDTRIDRHYFDDSMVRFFPSGDEEGLAEAILELRNNGRLRSRLIAKGREHVKNNNWSVKKMEYLLIVDRLTGRLDGGTTSLEGNHNVVVGLEQTRAAGTRS
jgi:glycosyltransferase involved in cell wall biosynthesis